MQFHQSHDQFNEKRLLLEKLKLMAIFSTASSCKSYSSPSLFQRAKESLWAIRECACQRVLCHISAICFKPTPPHLPPKKKNRQNKTYKLKVVLKGASKPILLDDTHNEPKMSFLSFFSSATHTTAAAAAAAVQCWGLSSLNRNVFSQLSIQKYFLFSVVSAMRSASRRRISFSFFHRSLNAKNLRGGNNSAPKKAFFLRDGWWWSSSGRRVLLYRPLAPV